MTRRPDPPRRPPRASALLYGAIAIVLLFGVALRVLAPPAATRTPDENAYTFYAAGLAHGGASHLPELVRGYVERPALHGLPPPTRIGHFGLVGGLMALTGNDTVATPVLLSTWASVLVLVLVAVLGLVFLDPWTTLLALGFAVVSPMDLALARRAWGDELLALATLATLTSFLAFQASARRPVLALACLLLAAYSVLVKETGALILALATVALAAAAWRDRGPWAAAVALGAGAIAGLFAVALLAMACGGLSTLRAAFAAAASAAASNPYVLRYQTGGLDYYPRGLTLLQPVPVVLGVCAALLAVARRASGRLDPARRREEDALVALGVLVLALGAAALVYPQKNLRFLSPLYAPLDLLAAALVVGTARVASRRLSPRVFRIVAAAGLVVLALSAATDHRRFVDTFLRRNVADLATPLLLERP